MRLPIDPESVKGFLAPEEGVRLYELAKSAARLGPCLEVGSYCGKSTVYLGSACREANQLLFAIDHHRGRLGWQQLHHGNAVVAGESMESWNREAALAAFVGAEDSCLELTLRDALDVLE